MIESMINKDLSSVQMIYDQIKMMKIDIVEVNDSLTRDMMGNVIGSVRQNSDLQSFWMTVSAAISAIIDHIEDYSINEDSSARTKIVNFD